MALDDILTCSPTAPRQNTCRTPPGSDLWLQGVPLRLSPSRPTAAAPCELSAPQPPFIYPARVSCTCTFRLFVYCSVRVSRPPPLPPAKTCRYESQDGYWVVAGRSYSSLTELFLSPLSISHLFDQTVGYFPSISLGRLHAPIKVTPSRHLLYSHQAGGTRREVQIILL